MSELEWADPPPTKMDRVTRVAAELRSRPGEWAKIDHRDGLSVMAWWSPLARDVAFEVHIVQTTDAAFGPRDVYARYAPAPDDDAPEGAEGT